VLAGIGLASGLFAALFGVGGGVAVVPLLILLAGYGSRTATGTSLAAIGLTAAFGTLAYGSSARSSGCAARSDIRRSLAKEAQ